LNVLWIVDDDHPPYMMEPMPFTRKYIRVSASTLKRDTLTSHYVDLLESPC
jgi:hypothetical protein